MSESSVLPSSRPAGHRARRRRSGCVPMLIFVAIAIVLGVIFVPKGIDKLQGMFDGPEDYPGPGHGEVMFVVDQGQSIPSMGEELADLGVVASADAFVDAASADERATGIQAGTYLLKKEMKASDVVDVLVNPKNLAQDLVTVPEGMRVTDVVALLAKQTEFPARAYEKVLAKPDKIGLPSYAGGDPEGYLFPATYVITPSDKPLDIVVKMVDRWMDAAEAVDLEAGAEALGYTPHEIMTVASLVEAEAQGDDMPKVARVIYNRLDNPDRGTQGLLQLDATVNFAHGRNLGARTTSEDRQIDSPYNTYEVPGLPPGPIEAPGEEAMEAALRPADGDWFYYVTVNLDTGETRFAATQEEHLANVELLNQYCRDESDRC